MSIPPVSRRQFLATGSALLAATYVPDWAEAFQAGATDDAARADAAEAALARATALGATYADIRVNRYRRESIATRERQVQNVSRSTSYGLGLRVLVNGTWGFAATNLVEPASARAVAEQAVAIARANALLTTRKVVLANADKVVTTWTNPIKRDPFEVPLETKTAFLMKLNETALAVPASASSTRSCSSWTSRSIFASSEGSRITQRLVRTYPQFTTTAVRSRRGRLPDARRRRSRQADGIRIRRGLPVDAGCRAGRSRSGRETEGQARRPRPLRRRRRSRHSCSSRFTNRSATPPSSIGRSATKRTWPAPAS